MSTPSSLAPSLALKTETLRVELGERSYDIIVGADLIGDAAKWIAPVLARPRVVIITDENVAPHYLAPLSTSLQGADIRHDALILPAGEQSKSFAQFEKLCESILALNIERSTTLVALGGGVIGDLVGYAAASILRGLPFIQVPTTLLSQVDSSVGGKTGINTAHGKNLVGAFYQPKLVLADTAALNTLDHRQLMAGYSEVVKYGLIDLPDFYEWLEIHAQALIDGDMSKRRYAVLTSCAAKARVVAEDEREGGKRALLNLGHTFGHALEAETGYGDALLHGEAVSIGTVMAFDLSQRLGLCPGQDFGRMLAHFDTIKLPTDLSRLNTRGWTVDKLMTHMSRDKKVEDGKLTFILATAIGQAYISRDVENEDVRELLNDWLKQ